MTDLVLVVVTVLCFTALTLLVRAVERGLSSTASEGSAAVRR